MSKWKYAKYDGIDLGSRYKVFESGNIVDTKSGGMITWNSSSSNGYPAGYFKDVNGNHYSLMIHRVVAATHIGKIAGKIVHHKNHDKLNPAVENLEILKDHAEHAKHHLVGDLNATATLTNDEVHKICQLMERSVKYSDIIKIINNPRLTEDILSKIAVGKNWPQISSQYHIPRIERSIMNEFSDISDDIGEFIVENDLTLTEASEYLGIERPGKRYGRFIKCARRYADKYYASNHA